MREILFRGKRIDNGEWVEGSLINDGRCFIAIHPSLAFGPTSKDEINGETLWGFYPFFEVDPSTVGQYTGKRDKNGKNGKKIFEGDIIRFNYDGAVGIVRFGEYMSPSDPNLTRHIGYYVDWQGKEKDFLRVDLYYWASRSDVEVVGNIHDNPELLEGKP